MTKRQKTKKRVQYCDVRAVSHSCNVSLKDIKIQQRTTFILNMYKHEILTIFPCADKHRIFRHIQAGDIYNISLCRKAQDI